MTPPPVSSRSAPHCTLSPRLTAAYALWPRQAHRARSACTATAPYSPARACSTTRPTLRVVAPCSRRPSSFGSGKMPSGGVRRGEAGSPTPPRPDLPTRVPRRRWSSASHRGEATWYATRERHSFTRGDGEARWLRVAGAGRQVFHCGQLRHGGAPVTAGRRYLLVCFIGVPASDRCLVPLPSDRCLVPLTAASSLSPLILAMLPVAPCRPTHPSC